MRRGISEWVSRGLRLIRGFGPWATVGVVAIVLGTSACGSGGGKSPTTGSTTPPTTTTGPTEAQRAADKTTAEASTLVLTDFPTGWVQEDKPSKSKGKCSSVEGAKSATSAHVGTPNFNDGDTYSVQNGVYMYTTVSQAKRAFSALSSSVLESASSGCWSQYSRRRAKGK